MVFSSIFTICKNRCILFFTLNSCYYCICNRWKMVYYSYNCSNELWNGQFFSEKKKLYSKNIRDNFGFNWYTSNYRFLPKLLRYFFPKFFQFQYFYIPFFLNFLELSCDLDNHSIYLANNQVHHNHCLFRHNQYLFD